MKHLRLPAGVWVLGFVSMSMDISSELIHSLLPVFMAGVLGASMTTIGIVEGVAEATASITKVFSGVLSDHLGKRKLLVGLGYGLATITKPIFPLATSMSWVFTARFIDRIGKGIRGAPRDALIADLTPRSMWGAAYGLRQSLDAVGAFVGPLLAVALMVVLMNDIRAVLWIAVIPGVLAVLLLLFGVHDPDRPANQQRVVRSFSISGLTRLPRRYWLITSLGAAFTLARFSEAFLILRASDVGLALALVPLVLIIMNLVYSAVAYPAGVVADRFGLRVPLFLGLVILVAADLLFAGARSPVHVLGGAALWGVHLGLTQGLFAKLVADTVPASRRGTAFGVFNLVVGVALLGASVLAGVLWSAFGAPVTFLVGAGFATLAMLGLLIYTPSQLNEVP